MNDFIFNIYKNLVLDFSDHNIEEYRPNHIKNKFIIVELSTLSVIEIDETNEKTSAYL